MTERSSTRPVSTPVPMNYHHYDGEAAPPMPTHLSNAAGDQIVPGGTSHKHTGSHTANDQVVPNMHASNGGQGYRASASARLYPRKHNMLGPYVMLQTVGEGEFAKVKLGMHVDTGEEAAIKLIRKENVDSSTRLAKIKREIMVLRSVRHPNVVRLFDVIETERYIGIVMEYASGGELFDHILAHRYLKEKDAARLFAQLISGVSYMHSKNIVHRDLKLENLLLDRNRNVIITDFGFANQFDITQGDLMATSCGSPCYAAPELVVSEGMYVGTAVDIWSCGVILYAMLAGYLPYDDDPANPDGDNINLLYKYILATSLVFPDYISPDARDLLRKMLVPDPRRRCTMEVIKQHRWLSAHAHIFEENLEDDGIEPLPSNLTDAEVNAATQLSYQQPPASTTQLAVSPPSSLAPPAMATSHKRHTIQLEYNNNPMEIEPLVDGTEIGARFRDDHAINPEGLHDIQGSSSTSLSGDQPNGDGTSNVVTAAAAAAFPSPPISPQPNWNRGAAEDASEPVTAAVTTTGAATLSPPSTSSSAASAAAAANKQNKKPPSRPTKTRPTTMMHYTRMAEEDDVIADLPLPNHTTRSERHRSMAGDNASIHSNGSRGNDSDSGRERRSNLTSMLFDRRSNSNSNSVSGRTGTSKRKAFSEVMSGGLGHLFNHDNDSRTATSTTLIASEEQNGTDTVDTTRRGKMNSRGGHSTGTAKKVMDWFRKRSLGKAMHRDDHPRRPTQSAILPGHDVKLRTHGGAIDEGALTSRPPKEVVAEIRAAILEMGLEILRESEFKFKCMRPNKTAPKRTTTAASSTSHDTASTSSSSNAWKRTSTLRGLLGRRMSVPHAIPGHHGGNDGPASVVGSTRTTSNSSTSAGVSESEAAYAALMAQTTIQPVYGEASIDAGDEIRFVVEICKIKNLTNLYIVDIRRMKGSIWSYKFLYHNLLERLDLKSKGFMNVQSDGTLV